MEVDHWSPTTLRQKLIKTDARLVQHAGYVTIEEAKVAVSRAFFEQIFRRISRFVPWWHTG